MKIRTARKILKIWDCQTDKRFYESDDIKDGKKFRHFANLYRKANVRWNKTNDPQANVSIFKAIIRNTKSCEHCAHYEAFQAYGRMVGRCELGGYYTESNNWCGGKYFQKSKRKDGVQ